MTTQQNHVNASKSIFYQTIYVYLIRISAKHQRESIWTKPQENVNVWKVITRTLIFQTKLHVSPSKKLVKILSMLIIINSFLNVSAMTDFIWTKRITNVYRMKYLAIPKKS
jgi:hypothetical protein